MRGRHDLGEKRDLSKQTLFQSSRCAGSGILCPRFAAGEFSLGNQVTGFACGLDSALWLVCACGWHRRRSSGAMPILRALIAVALTAAVMGCGRDQGSKGDPGPPGPPGPKGDPGSPGPNVGIRVIRSPCDATNCTVQCNADEMLLTAYCGPRRNAAIIPTKRSATCRSPVPANSPLVAACVKMPPQ